MFFLKTQNIIKVSLTLSVLWVLLFGFSQFGMNMDMQDGMINCPFMPGHSAVICQMNPLEHIQEWQNMFIALPMSVISILIFVILLLFVLKRFKFWDTLQIPEISNFYSKFSFSDNFKAFNPLQEAFSQGILNPKLF